MQEWRLKTSHADNHYLDTEVYAMCAADMLGARSLHLEEVDMEPRTEAKPQPEPKPEDNWLGTNGQWLYERTIRMRVIRKAVTANTPVTFKFESAGSQFLVKNFTEDQITVGILDQEVLIPANSAQLIATRLEPSVADLTDTLTVTAVVTDATGVEVQCLSY